MFSIIKYQLFLFSVYCLYQKIIFILILFWIISGPYRLPRFTEAFEHYVIFVSLRIFSASPRYA